MVCFSCAPGLPIAKELYVDMGREPSLLTAIFRRIAERFDILASRLCSGKGHDACASLHHYYGAELFCCPIPSCSRHSHGFETRNKRQAHVMKHQRPVKCAIDDCDFGFIGFESEADRDDHMSNCHNLAQQVEVAWEDMDDRHCFRVLCSAARECEFGLVQSLLSLIYRKIIILGGFGKLLLAAGEGQSIDIINLVISVYKSISKSSGRGHLEEGTNSLYKQLQEALNNAALHGLEALVRGMCRSNLLASLNYTSTGPLSLKGKSVRRGYKPLHLAVLGQSESIVKQLLDSGASVVALSQKDRLTALHLAAKDGHEAIARLLLDCGADIEARDAKGYTALHWATKQEATTRLLLDRGADIDAKDKNGCTALHWVARYGQEAITRMLLDRGADIEARDAKGYTALHWATKQEAITRLLIDRGADIEAKLNDHRTALDLATENRSVHTARLLRHRMIIN